MIKATSPRVQIEKLLTDVGKLKTDVRQLETEYQDCYYTSQDTGRNLQSAEWPLRRAESDNAQTDVSFDGRQAESYLNSAERGLDKNERDLRNMDFDSNQAATDFDKAQRDLQQIIADSSAYPSSLASLRQAKSDLDGAAGQHDTADSQGGWARNKTDSAARELQWAESSVRNITYDRPGVDVSSDARQASSRVDRAHWDVRDTDSNLSQARNGENRSVQGLGNVEQQLRQALAQLPANA